MGIEFFPGFEQHSVPTQAGRLNVRKGGKGPALLLLHGYPQTHVNWHKVAPDLARHFTLIIPDLPGYGESEGPAASDVAGYSKRSMAAALVEMMSALGFEKFSVAGHDRGARVTYRMALDHPARILRAACLDIMPTLVTWEYATGSYVVGGFHWGFLAQPAPFPEQMLAENSDLFLEHCMKKWAGDISLLDPRAMDHYREAYRRPSVIAATCNDYRAGATIDCDYDRADRDAGRKITCPLLVIWGGHSGMSAEVMLGGWKDFASVVSGEGLRCGHFMSEEAPDQVVQQLTKFFAG